MHSLMTQTSSHAEPRLRGFPTPPTAALIPPRAEPIFFGPTDRLRFGWIHASSAPATLGLVVCNPFGYELMCAHRSLRHFAEAAAANGVPAMRFDYDGTGDSAGTDLDPKRVAAWVASVGDAIDELRRRTGVKAVAVLGVRLGALLAALAAERRDDVVGLAAIAPVVSGRAYTRELRALQMAVSLGDPPAGATQPEGVQEVVGFALANEAKDELAKTDLLKTTKRPAPSVLIMDRDDLPGSDAWAKHLRALDVMVDQQRLPGYVEMMLDPHKAVVPSEMVRTTTEWLNGLAGKLGEPAPFEAPRDAGASAAIVTADGPIVETPVFIDGERTVFGVLSSRATAPARRRGVLLISAGATHHIGPNRLHVALARRLAARGHAVLRMDVSGIGDSRPHAGEPENYVYTARATEDVAAAFAFLAKQPGVAECYAIGICSGAYNAVRAAVAGVRFAGIIPINPLTFFWKDGMTIDDGAFHVAAEADRYAGAARSLESWKKLFRGEVKVRAVVDILRKRAISLLEYRVRDVARRIGRPFPDDLGADLEKIAKQRVTTHFMFAASDPGFELLRIGAGAAVPRLRASGKLRVDVIDGPDHTFTPLWSHAPLLERLEAALDAMP